MRSPILLLLIAGCLTSPVLAAGGSDSAQAARQLASSVDDNIRDTAGRRAAIDSLEQASRLYLDDGEGDEAARTLSREARLHSLLNEPKKALDTYNRALLNAKDTNLRMDCLNGAAIALLTLGNREKSESVVHQALDLSSRSDYPIGRANALLTLAELQNFDHHPLGLDTTKTAMAVFESIGDKAGTARAAILAGRCSMAQDLLPQATEYFQSALQIRQDIGDREGQAEALIKLCYVQERRSDWSQAISYLLNAQSLLDDTAQPLTLGQIATGLAECFNANGLPEAGLTHFQQALVYYRQTNNPFAIWYATQGIGNSHYLLHEYPDAILDFKEALSGVAANGIEAAQTDQFLGQVYSSMGEDGAALENLNQSLKIYPKKNSLEIAEVRGLIGQVLEHQGNAQQARLYFKKALESFDQLSDRSNQGAIYFALGRLEMRENNLDVAEGYLQKSVEITDDLRRATLSTDLTAAFSATVYDRYEMYIECLMHEYENRPDQALLIRAFETSERFRGHSLAELLRTTQEAVIKESDPDLIKEEESLRRELGRNQDAKIDLLKREYTTQEMAELNAEIASIQTQHDHLLETIRSRYPGLDQILSPAALTLEQIQNDILGDDQTLLLEYALGAEKGYVWAVTRDSITSYPLPPRATIEDAARSVYNLLAAPPAAGTEEQLPAAIKNLSELVIAPIEAELTKRRIIVVPDGTLNYIPFQVLIRPSAGDEPLVTNYEIINIPSASIMGELHKTAVSRHPSKIVAAFGDPVFQSNYAQVSGSPASAQATLAETLETRTWQHTLRDVEMNGDRVDLSVIEPLFYARRELNNLRRAASGQGALICSDFAASRDQLLDTDLSQYAILHLATHGFLDATRPENSGIILSTVGRDGKPQNGFVGLKDIYALHAPVDLVVLSACRTALGKEVRGEGLLGITRGFMYAGASSVMSSLWKVDDEATAELMRHFYDNLLQKKIPPAAALMEAQNEIRRKPEWRSPYYWAAFTFQGEYRQIQNVPSPAARRMWVIAVAGACGALVALSAITLFYRKRRRSDSSEPA